MLNKHNQDIIEALIKFIPQLSNELANQEKTNQKNYSYIRAKHR